MLQAAIVGGTGYTGIELIRLLSSHPEVTIKWLTSRSEAGKPVASIFPSLRGISDLTYSDLGEDTLEALATCDVVFFATPHGGATQRAPDLVNAGLKGPE